MRTRPQQTQLSHPRTGERKKMCAKILLFRDGKPCVIPETERNLSWVRCFQNGVGVGIEKSLLCTAAWDKWEELHEFSIKLARG